jgi:hypothetical protein
MNVIQISQQLRVFLKGWPVIFLAKAIQEQGQLCLSTEKKIL